MIIVLPNFCWKPWKNPYFTGREYNRGSWVEKKDRNKH